MKIPLSLMDTWRLTRRSFAEMSIGIIVGCLPTLPRFFKQFHQRRSISSDTTEVHRGSNSGRKCWHGLSHRPPTAYTDSNQVRVFQMKGLGSRSSMSTAPYLPPLNFSDTSIGMFDESLPKKPLPTKSKHISATYSELWRAPTPWTPNDEGGGSRVQQDSSNSKRILCQRGS